MIEIELESIYRSWMGLAYSVWGGGVWSKAKRWMALTPALSWRATVLYES